MGGSDSALYFVPPGYLSTPPSVFVTGLAAWERKDSGYCLGPSRLPWPFAFPCEF